MIAWIWNNAAEKLNVIQVRVLLFYFKQSMSLCLCHLFGYYVLFLLYYAIIIICMYYYIYFPKEQYLVLILVTGFGFYFNSIINLSTREKERGEGEEEQGLDSDYKINTLLNTMMTTSCSYDKNYSQENLQQLLIHCLSLHNFSVTTYWKIGRSSLLQVGDNTVLDVLRLLILISL